MDIAISALSRKRAELAGEIIARSAALDQLRADLAHLDAAIRIMCPDAEPELIQPKKPSRKGCDWFGRQELPRLILATLRAEQLLSPTEIARAVMACKGLDAADRTALLRITGMVKGALHRRQGRMVERVGNGRDVRWRLQIDGLIEARNGSGARPQRKPQQEASLGQIQTGVGVS